MCTRSKGFQSTHPVRGATGRENSKKHSFMNFNPRTPCGVRRQTPDWNPEWYNFNPRTPCGVRRSIVLKRLWFCLNFNPRTPCGVRRFRCIFNSKSNSISIHAPRAGCDNFTTLVESSAINFNPRTPCGVRPAPGIGRAPWASFQSTHPVRGATCAKAIIAAGIKFQSTHPVRGATASARA